MPPENVLPMPAPADPHEARLRDHDAAISELRVLAAKGEADVEHLKDQVSTAYDRLAEKIDKGLAPVVSLAEETKGHLEALGDRVGEHGRTLEKAAEREALKAARWDGWKRMLVPAVSGALAIGVKELIVFIARHW